jgi:ubiquitination network signaling protein AcrB
MPRGTSAAKRQQGAANHRDTRHENGLVGPGKRVQKQKSNGHLNGHAKSSEINPSPPPLPGTPPPTNGHVRHPSPADNPSDHKMHADNLRRSSVSGDSEFSSAESYHNTPAISVSQENHRRIDVNAAKNPAVHRDVGAFGFALTVLRSCPLYDTIAILIVLLQIPPTFLSLIHLLFATLTFVPPSNSGNSALSFTDIFEGNLGTPSVATIVVIDAFVLMVWLFLWTPFQDIALDLAQTVIALTLGGGTSGREAGMNNVLVCFSIIGVSHFTRNGNVKHSGIRALLSSSSNGLIKTSDPDDPLEPISHDGKPQNTHGWVRSILAIHILTQGVVRYIRDWYVRREKRDNSAAVDPEAGKSVADTSADSSATNTQTPDAESSNLLPASNAAVTSKKKRKHSAQVRLRQPLWSALASTKIVMVKEYETSHTAAESAGANATDVNNLGNAPFDTEADRIWITYVGSDEVFFSTSYFPAHTPPETVDRKCLEAGVDNSKPFFVRVNKTIWQPTRINITNEAEPSGQETRWSGEIFGLAPMSSYQCEFISTIDGTTIFSTSVRTLQPPTTDIAVGLSPNPAFGGRPGSPITTLKTSIASSEIKLSEERSRQKRERKEQRAKLASLRREIEKLGNSIASGGGNEDRQKQKHQQHLSHMKQAEEAILALNAQIENLEAIPTDENSQYMIEKRDFQSQREQYKQSRNAFNEAKAAADRDIQALSNEVTTLQQKRERMQSRIVKLNGEHERITDANARGLDEAQRKERERIAKEAERAKMEMMYLERLQAIAGQVGETTGNLHALNATIDSLQQLELYAHAQQANSPNSSVPNLNASFDGTIPENVIPGNYPWTATGAGPIYSTAFVNPMLGTNSSPAGHRMRGRSSSMLSNVSGFTQSSGEGPPPILTFNSGHGMQYNKGLWEDSTADFEDAKDRQGSSGSGSGSGSVGDPKSPIGNGNGNGRVVKW